MWSMRSTAIRSKVAERSADASARNLGAQVQLEIRRDRAQLAQSPRLELAHPLTGDAEPSPDLFEGLRRLPVEAEAERKHTTHARVQSEQRLGELLAAQLLRRRLVGTLGVDVLDQVGVHALAVAYRGLEADWILDEVEQLLHTFLREATLLRELLHRRLAIQLLRELAARAHEPTNLVRDVDRKTDRAALDGERARSCLADPPGRIGRKLVAELVVELLDRADQPEVPLLNQIEQRHPGLRVVPRDRHHEAQVRLDQLLLRLLVALVLAAGERPLLGRRQQRPVAARADIALEGVLRGLGLDRDRGVVVVPVLGLFGLFGLLGLLRHKLEAWLDRGVRGHVGKRPHASSIGVAERMLERSVNPRRREGRRNPLTEGSPNNGVSRCV